MPIVKNTLLKWSEVTIAQMERALLYAPIASLQVITNYGAHENFRAKLKFTRANWAGSPE